MIKILILLSSLSFSQTPAPKDADAASKDRPYKTLTKIVGDFDKKNTKYISSRDVILSTVIGRVLEGQGVKSILDVSDSSFASASSQYLTDAAIHLEALSLSSDEAVSGDEVTSLKNKVAGQTKDIADFKKLEFSADEIQKMSKLKLVVKNFENIKKDSFRASISESDMFDYLKRNRSQFGVEKVPPHLTDELKNRITSAILEVRLREWREVLRKKYQTRNYQQ